MIHITCDNCDKPLQVPDELAGTKYPCPDCGDINRVPPAPGSGSSTQDDAKNESPPEPKPEPTAKEVNTVVDRIDEDRPIDKAAAAGYPPDHGPETKVIKVRRCWFRSRAGRFMVTTAILLASLTGLLWMHLYDKSHWWMLLCIPGAVFSLGLLAWWWIDRFSASLVITTKRATMHNGFFRRSTSEVVHDNIRNVQVDQTFWQRVWKVGKIGISSSGQDGVEVQVNHLPNPDKLREIIDLYRPL